MLRQEEYRRKIKWTRFRIVLYEIAVALFLGLMVGGFSALMQVYLPVWCIPVLLFGGIAIGAVLGIQFFNYIANEYALWSMRLQRRTNTSMVRGLLLLLIFITGFLVPYAVTGNLVEFGSKIRYLPKTIIGQHIGGFEEDMFERAYNRAITHIGDRPIESLLFYKSLTSVIVEKPDKENGFNRVTLRGASISTHSHPVISPEDRLFTVNQVPSLAIFKNVLADAAKEHHLKRLTYIGLWKDVRWGVNDETGKQDFSRYVNIKLLFKDGSSLRYDGETGHRIVRTN